MAINKWLLIAVGAAATALAALHYSGNPDSVMPAAYVPDPHGPECQPVRMLELQQNQPRVFCSHEPALLRSSIASPGIFYMLGLGNEHSTRVVSIAELVAPGIGFKTAQPYYIGILAYSPWTELPDLIVVAEPE